MTTSAAPPARGRTPGRRRGGSGGTALGAAGRARGRVTRLATRVVHHPLLPYVLLALLPILAAAVRAWVSGWAPEGDDAIIGMRVRDALSSNLPLVGMRSTSGLEDPALASHHPGPLEFYLLALPAALLGFSGAGLVLGVALLNAAAVVGTLVIGWQLGRHRVVLPLTGAVLALEWSLGAALLVRPLNTFVAAFPLLLVLVSATALLLGRLGPMWVFALSATLVAQSNVAYAPLVAAVALLLAAVGLVRWWRVRHAVWPLPGWRPHRRQRRWGPGRVTAVVLALAWMPPLVELLTATPNNLTQLLAYRADGAQQGGGVRPDQRLSFAVGQLVPVARLGRYGDHLAVPPSPAVAALGMIMVLLLALAAVGGKRQVTTRRPWTVGRLACALAVFSLAAEVWALSFLRVSIAAAYWLLPTIVVSVFAWAALGIRVLELLPAGIVGRAGRQARLAAVALLVVALVPTLTTPTDGAWRGSRDAQQVSDAVLTALRERVRPGSDVVVLPAGLWPYLSLASAVGFQTERAGFRTYAVSAWPYPEDMAHRQIDAAPADSVRVFLQERQADGTWPQLPPGTERIPLPAVEGRPELAFSLLVPPASRRIGS